MDSCSVDDARAGRVRAGWRESSAPGLANKTGRTPALPLGNRFSRKPQSRTASTPGGAPGCPCGGACLRKRRRKKHKCSVTTFSIPAAAPAACCRSIRSGMKVEGLGGEHVVATAPGPGPASRLDLLRRTATCFGLVDSEQRFAPREHYSLKRRTPAVPRNHLLKSSPQQNETASRSQEVHFTAVSATTCDSPPPAVRTPQQLFEQLQRMLTGRQRHQQRQPIAGLTAAVSTSSKIIRTNILEDGDGKISRQTANGCTD